jgi:uncharacterized RDD family membrane protein YckC
MEGANANPHAPPVAPYEPPPEQSDPPRPWPASRGRRLFGTAIDNLLLIAAIVAGVQAAQMLKLGDSPEMGLAALGALTALGGQAYLVATSGQSVANKLLKMRIERLDGSAPGFRHGVLIRSWVTAFIKGMLVGLFAMVPPLIAAGFVADAVPIFGSERRCLHDRLAGTRVVRIR